MQFKPALFKGQLYKQVRQGELIYLFVSGVHGPSMDKVKTMAKSGNTEVSPPVPNPNIPIRGVRFFVAVLDSSLLKKLSGLQLSVPTAKAMDASCEFSLSPLPSEQEMCMLYVD